MANARNLTALAVKLGMRYYEEQNLVFGKLAGETIMADAQ